MSETPASILDAARTQLCMRLEATTHPVSGEQVDVALVIVRIALAKQRRMIARRLRREAAEWRRGWMTSVPTNQRLTYDGGLRRAAKIVEASGE